MNELYDAWTRSDDLNFALLGEAEIAGDFGLNPLNRGEIIEIGRQWMADHRDRLCGYVCPHEKIKKMMAAENIGLDVCSVVFDILEHHLAKISPVPAAAVAVLFVKLGYHRLCANYSPASTEVSAPVI